MTWVYDPDHNKSISHKQIRQKLAKTMNQLRSGKNPRPVSFRMKPKKKADETYPLKLTQQQRKTLIHCTRLRLSLKKKIEAAGAGTQVIGFTRKELDHLNDEISTAAIYAPSPHKKRLITLLGKVAAFFEDENEEVFVIDASTSRKNRSGRSGLLYQFKITLHDSKPPIWRRVQVADCTLDKLHEHIQTAMGWENSHLHQFEISGNRYGDPKLLGGMGLNEFKNSLKTKLSEILPANGKKFRFRYEYDFGDGWLHEILFEGCPEPEKGMKYPLCVEGERACPPDDCGGIWGYYEMLSALADPTNEQHDHFMEWIGEVDPDEFNAVKATKEMKKGLPSWRE